MLAFQICSAVSQGTYHTSDPTKKQHYQNEDDGPLNRVEFLFCLVHVAINKYVTLAVEGAVVAPPVPIFCNGSKGHVLFTTGLTKEIYPQWWGAAGDVPKNGLRALWSRGG